MTSRIELNVMTKGGLQVVARLLAGLQDRYHANLSKHSSSLSHDRRRVKVQQ